MAQLNREQLQFCFDELLGELGWGDEIAETGVDPLNGARDEIKDLHKHIKRLRKSLELRNAAEQPLALDEFGGHAQDCEFTMGSAFCTCNIANPLASKA